jgi:phosphoglycerol transferase MdoB-like AlkP superfamily enzyme
MSSVPQKLSFTLDALFNDNYNQSNQLDTKISTNEDLVRTYMDTYQTQMLKNDSLKILLLASTLIMILMILYRINVIQSSMILMIAIVGIIVLSMLVIYFSYYNNDFQSYPLEMLNFLYQMEGCMLI